VTVKLSGTPDVALVGAEIWNLVAATKVVEMGWLVIVHSGADVSVTVIVCLPGVFRETSNVPAPSESCELPGNNARVSVDEKWTMPEKWVSVLPLRSRAVTFTEMCAPAVALQRSIMIDRLYS